jgi:hypothetical protein
MASRCHEFALANYIVGSGVGNTHTMNCSRLPPQRRSWDRPKER